MNGPVAAVIPGWVHHQTKAVTSRPGAKHNHPVGDDVILRLTDNR